VNERLVARALARASARTAPLGREEARRIVRDSDGPFDSAMALEEALGGVELAGVTLGIDTHRTRPPRDPYDEWLSRDLQRRMIQIGFGGPHRATFWLDRRGWVHEIAPLDRLYARAPDAATFVAQLLGEAPVELHRASFAFWPLSADDADALFGGNVGCPVGTRPVRWTDDALEVLEEQAWVEAHASGPRVVISAPSIDALAEPLAALATVAPEVTWALLDGGVRAEVSVTSVEAVHAVRSSWRDATFDLTLGRDADGRWMAA